MFYVKIIRSMVVIKEIWDDLSNPHENHWCWYGSEGVRLYLYSKEDSDLWSSSIKGKSDGRIRQWHCMTVGYSICEEYACISSGNSLSNTCCISLGKKGILSAFCNLSFIYSTERGHYRIPFTTFPFIKYRYFSIHSSYPWLN